VVVTLFLGWLYLAGRTSVSLVFVLRVMFEILIHARLQRGGPPACRDKRNRLTVSQFGLAYPTRLKPGENESLVEPTTILFPILDALALTGSRL
jgi:hypothetical protein